MTHRAGPIVADCVTDEGLLEVHTKKSNSESLDECNRTRNFPWQPGWFCC